MWEWILRTHTQQPRDTIYHTASELNIICFHLFIFPGCCCFCSLFGLFRSLELFTYTFICSSFRPNVFRLCLYLYLCYAVCLFCITFSFASLLVGAMNLLVFLFEKFGCYLSSPLHRILFIYIFFVVSFVFIHLIAPVLEIDLWLCYVWFLHTHA